MDQLMSNLSTLQPLMRIMLIVDDSRLLTLEEKLDSAFRLPETEESRALRNHPVPVPGKKV